MRPLPSQRGTIVALVSSRGGGDAPPVLTLAVALSERGYDVRLLCDGDLSEPVRRTRLPVMHLPRATEQSVFYDPLFLPRMAERGEQVTAEIPDPLLRWVQACLPVAVDVLAGLNPKLLLSTLFCMSLTDRLASKLCIPWVFVNPGFYFGEDAPRRLEADFPGLTAGVFRHWYMPLAARADMVLHATDPEFDPPPSALPAHHHYVGPLISEPLNEIPAFLTEPGDPWVLVALSTVPQAGEIAIAQLALKALKDRSVRVLVTLAPRHPATDIIDLPSNARVEGFVPHGPVLERACLVISHGGHGVVMKALHYGVPMIVVPWGRDQIGVAARARSLGVAEVVPRSELNAERLAEAVSRVLASPSNAIAARRISNRLQGEDPPERACALIAAVLRAATL